MKKAALRGCQKNNIERTYVPNLHSDMKIRCISPAKRTMHRCVAGIIIPYSQQEGNR
nr:MAG TPA: Frog antimicrobial peptide [Caudoviricetes sp.]DAL11296.1 MAG TPA_asm: Frog antimicrobial peptide [Caudoviricetes sp.]